MHLFLGTAGIPLGAGGSTIEGIEYVRKIGLNAMEVEFVRGVNMGPGTAKLAGEASADHGVRLSVHAPYFINLCNPDKKRASEKRITDSCERAHTLGANIVVFHAGFYGDLSRKQALEEVIDSCLRMSAWMDKRGISGVSLGIETTGKKSQFGEVEEIVEVCRSVRACAPVIDFAHIYARQGGHMDTGIIFSSIKPLHLGHLNTHFSGIEFNASGERRHLPIGKGGPDFRSVARAVAQNMRSATVICESPLLEKDALKMKKIFESLGQEIWKPR